MKIERDIGAIDRLATVVTGHRDVIEVQHTDLVEQRRRQSDEVRGLTTELDQHRRERAAPSEQQLDASRERARQAELGEAEAKLRLETAIETLRRELDIEPAVAEAAPMPVLPEGATPAGRVYASWSASSGCSARSTRSRWRSSTNSRRHTFLETQLEDVRSTRRELSRVIAAVDAEIQNVFTSAFNDVSENFTQVVRAALPGWRRQAQAHHPRRHAQHRHRGRGQAEREERQEVVAAVGWRAQPHRPGLSLCRLPLPPVAVLRHGRGRGGARRRQPAPLPRPHPGVPQGRPAHRRVAPEAHDGGRRQPAGREHAARRLEQGRHRARSESAARS